MLTELNKKNLRLRQWSFHPLRLFSALNKRKNALTTVELVVTVSILILVSGVIFGNYSGFRENVSIKRTAQEIALAIREAQVYGLSVKEYLPGSNTFPGYGVHFALSASDNFIVFADVSNLNYYDPGSGCGSGSTECVENYKITTGGKITALCGGIDCSLSDLNVIFLRPNPFVILKTESGTSYSDVSIKITSPGGKIKTIRVLSTGQISVE